mmetsp:Transcript_27192/g.82496  ORF Transcript_27192/g.82496 Transcript_27192/m.82496 type:complete len:313 (+) Transcript_27192:84-1022(+)
MQASEAPALSLDHRVMQRFKEREDPNEPNVHKYRVTVPLNEHPQKVVLHLPCRCSVYEGRHLLTFTVPPNQKSVVVRWDSNTCQLDFGQGQRSAARSRVRDAMNLGPVDHSCYDPSEPLRIENALGRRVLIPAQLWPDYDCHERGGKGWEATVVNVQKREKMVTVRFLHATDGEGKPYADEIIPFKEVRPLTTGAQRPSPAHEITPTKSSAAATSQARKKGADDSGQTRAAKRPARLSAGSRALAPAHLWPDQSCDEHDGEGWEVIVRNLRGRVATIEFIRATDEEGRPFEPLQVEVKDLKLLGSTLDSDLE